MPDLGYLDEHHSIIGTQGGGKTTTAKFGVEQLLRERRHVLILDPLGVWYGLRSNAAGTGAGFDIAIFGGEHGDVPIRPKDGGAIARIVIEQRVSAIVDISEFRDGPVERMFVRELVAGLRRKAKGNFHFVADESDLWCPEKTRDDVGFALQEDMIWIVQKGRSAGFVLTSITQRPADIAKSLITQSKTIIAHQLMAPQDQKPFLDYIRTRGSKADLDAIAKTLPELQVGERYIYSPARRVLERGITPPIATFDSSATPAPGAERAEPKMLSQIDVTAIRAALAPPTPVAAPEDAIPADPEDAWKRGSVVGEALATRDRRIAQLQRENAELLAQIEHLEQVDAECERYSRGIQAIADLVYAVGNGEELPPVNRQAPSSTQPLVRKGDDAAPTAPKPKVVKPVPADVAPDRALGGERKPLALLAGVAPAGMKEADWAVLAGFKRTGGTWGTYKSRLRTAGLAELRDGLWCATAAGNAAIGNDVVQLPPPGKELVALWADRIPGVSRMLNLLATRFPHHVTREGLAADLGMTASGGTFGTYLSRLRANGLLEEKGKRIRLSSAVMGGSSDA